jgi:hypothetical protein
MSSIDPPRLPAWMLEHLNAGNSNEALAGDLVEEVRCGRSAVWYWRQVLGALARTRLDAGRHEGGGT